MQGSEKESFDEFDFLSAYEEGSDQDLKTRYEATIKNPEKVFSSADIYYGFHEELFSGSSYQKIKNF